MCVLCVRRARGTSSTSYKIGGAKSRASESDVIESTNDSSARPPSRDQQSKCNPSSVVLGWMVPLAQISATVDVAITQHRWLCCVKCVVRVLFAAYTQDTRVVFTFYSLCRRSTICTEGAEYLNYKKVSALSCNCWRNLYKLVFRFLMGTRRVEGEKQILLMFAVVFKISLENKIFILCSKICSRMLTIGSWVSLNSQYKMRSY
jgi:hypothetical protein